LKNFKIFLVIAIFALVLSVSFASYAAPTFRVAMVTDVGGLGDKSFNDAAFEGLNKLKKELGCEIKVVESAKMEDYVPNLKSLADQKYDMIWAIGFLMTDALTQVAKMYPEQKFGFIDSVVNLPNVHNVTFKEQEGSFLVGVIAATDSKKKKVGFVGGMEFPIIQKFEAGFKAGVKAVDPKIKVFSAYVGAFDNPGKGKELANAQFIYGVDVIYHAAGASGLGVINAAKEKGKGYWAIGVDRDQYNDGMRTNKTNCVLASMVKRVDVAIYKSSSATLNGKFAGGTVTELGLAENGVGVSENAKKTASKNALTKAEAYRKKIITGKIKVPTNPKEVK